VRSSEIIPFGFLIRYVGEAAPDRAEALIWAFTHKIFRP